MPKSRNRRSNGKTKKQENQDSSRASGTLVDVRRTMHQAGGRDDRAMRYVVWATVALIGLFLTLAVLMP